ncbi:sigma-E processing peptidase SpoIIGA [Caldalkalibacillus salinus]|uniref:sigma-E processing peptidase SpoIIGA n=1 Tax=Caldalkalibacillus salinus TaxID=2803787 RepID=UPI00192248DB|nr:sigma-E processing peptidase SpoIIGA [Caldalkalibacillus salinus]
MYLYLDLIWLLNFFIDYLLLWMTGYFRKIPLKKSRLVLASAIGSSYVFILFLPPLSSYYTFLSKIVLSLVIVSVAFGFGNFQRFIQAFLMFYFVSFVTGGGILAIHSMLQTNHEVMQGILSTQSGGVGDPVSWLFVIIGFMAMYGLTKSRWHQLEITKAKEGVLADVRIRMGEHEISCTGLIDTGNQLHDPLTKMPVMMLQLDTLKPLLPDSVVTLVEQEKVGEWQGVDSETEWAERLRIIPYRGVRQGLELMAAIKPDNVQVTYEGKTYDACRVLIGVNPQPLSHDGQFEAILHPAQLQTQEKEEAI